ncbi:hypothetical protein [Nonomuraea phyllanthi]|uniref:hypothetical protein n=1 Tax=Nonomuraea phyllanthi TaxID=2219224 RepID=UPI00186ACEBD|nr:hypothetical protein [Nonomuraea phyllanthi]
MIKTLRKWGVKSNHMYMAGIASVGLAFTSWLASNKFEAESLDRADRWGIFVGEWAPTFFAMGIALRMEEITDTMTETGRYGGMEERFAERPSEAALR